MEDLTIYFRVEFKSVKYTTMSNEKEFGFILLNI
jgi:hypothetical protein